MANIPPDNINVGDVSGGNINIGGTQHFHAPVTIQSYAAKSPLPDNLPELTFEVVTQAFNAATAHLANIRGTFADTGIQILRSEIGQILNWINLPPSDQEKPQKLALVAGKPGQGKSVVMRQLVEALKAAGCTILGIKADNLAGLNQTVLTISDLQALLQLPGSIETCVKTVATDSLCIVLIDQLDTLALTLNTDEQSLRVVVNLIDRLREIPNVKIVVTCRDFERLNDPVLGGIKIDQSFQVGELRESDINQVLQQINQPLIQELPKPLQHLLKTPLYLDIYVRIAVSGETSNLSQITTLQDLYGRLWSLRIERPHQNAPSPAERRQAVFHLVGLMQLQRKLKLHVSSLDDYPTVRQYLQRTGFIQEDGHNLSFLHQTLFSYCYARKFVSEQRSLSSDIFTSPQGFFERQLMVEVLQHLRSTDVQAYHAEVTTLLFPPEDTHIRYHLRLLLLKLLAWQIEPTEQEYSLVIRLERTGFDDFERWLRNTGGNEGWFQRLEGDVQRWLASRENSVVTMAIYYLANFLDTRTTFVIEHIKPYLDRNQEWNQRIAWTLLRLKNWSDANDAVQLLMSLVRNDVVSIQASNHSLVSMANSNVVAGCKLLKLHCELALINYQVLKSKQTDPYSKPSPRDALQEATDSWEVRGFISVACRTHPQAILDYLLPWFITTTVELTEKRDQTKLYYPSNWFFDDLDKLSSIHHRDGISFADAILEGLCYLARTDPFAFREKVSELAPINVRIIQQLLLRAFRANPSEYINEIYDFLTGDNRRLQIQPDVRHLFGVAYGRSDQSLRNKWENFIFSLPQTKDDTEEKSLENWRRHFLWREHDQLEFLVSVDESLLSDYARRRKYEILRLPDFKNYSPSDNRWGEVTWGEAKSPIPSERQRTLSDEDWLRIMRRYDDETSWDKPRKGRHLLEGGVIEMSRSLIEQVKANPERFYLLSQKFDQNISVEYIAAVIQGFAHKDTTASPQWMFDVFRRFYFKITGFSRIGVSKALSVKAPDEVPDDIIDVLVTWAKDDPNPNCQEEQQNLREILSDTTPFSDGLINRAINSVRSSVLEDICRILFHKSSVSLERIFGIIEQGTKDDCASVRLIAVQELAHWHNKSNDRESSLRLFDGAILGHPILLTSYPIHQYLNWLSFNDPLHALPYAQIMLEIPHERTQQMAAQLICVAGLYEKEGFSAIASSLHQSENPAIRRGTAVIYVQEIAQPEKTMICCERLLILMQDEDEHVRIQSAGCFRRLQSKHLLHLQNFFRQFIKTPALQHGGDDFIEFLTRVSIVTPQEQHLSLSLVKDLLDTVGTNIGNYDRGFLTLQREMTLFLRNLYDKTIDQQLRESIMDLFDTMLRLGSDEAHKMLQSEDAEWMPHL